MLTVVASVMSSRDNHRYLSGADVLCYRYPETSRQNQHVEVLLSDVVLADSSWTQGLLLAVESVGEQQSLGNATKSTPRRKGSKEQKR